MARFHERDCEVYFLDLRNSIVDGEYKGKYILMSMRRRRCGWIFFSQLDTLAEYLLSALLLKMRCLRSCSYQLPLDNYLIL